MNPEAGVINPLKYVRYILDHYYVEALHLIFILYMYFL